MKHLLAACIVAAVFVGDAAAAQKYEGEQASLAHARELPVEFMKKLVAGDDRGALELLRSRLPVSKAEFDASRDKTLSARGAFDARYGKIVGYAVIREERVADLLLRITCVEKRTKHLVRWQFTFYRPGAEWRLNSFNWDDNASALFEGAAPPPLGRP